MKIFLATIKGKPPDEGRPVGHVMLNCGNGVAGLYELGVPQKMCRKSIGSALMLAAMQKARDLGYKVAVLQTNPGLKSVYQRLGFREVTMIEYWLYSQKASKTPPALRSRQVAVEKFLTALLTDKTSQAIKILKKYPKVARNPLPGFEGVTALHIAAWNGFNQVVRVLIDLGAPLEARDDQYKGTPLHWAVHGLGKNGPIIERDQLGAAKALLCAGAKKNAVNKWNISPLYLARKTGHRPIIRLLTASPS